MKKKILVFPAGSECGIDIYKSLRYNLHFEVFGASGRHDHGDYIYPEDHLVVSDKLFISNPDFVTDINSIIGQFDIDFIIPTHDTIAKVLMEQSLEINAVVVCSPLKTAQMAEDKNLTYKKLKDKSYYPKVFSKDEDIMYPAFLKPYIAAGGKGTVKVNNKEELSNALKNNSNLLICEYLPGDEITVDCFTDKDRKLLFVGARTRDRITNGITYSSEVVEMTKEIEDIANDLNGAIHFRGAWYFQLKKNSNGEYKFMEFSVRQAGTMTFYRQLGINFALLSLFDRMDYPLNIIYNHNLGLKLDRGIETLYSIKYQYSTLYVDYDDTLIVDGKVNTLVLQLIYQSFNKGIKVVLLTKHIGDLNDSLKQYRLSKEVFDEIILISPNTKKADYIKETNAIFIDNYFPERLEVYQKCNIPVFDVDAVEMLIDKRNL